nr:MAG TPA: NinB protein [Caudoviricetes sp.]
MKTAGKVKEIITDLNKLDMDKFYVCEINEPKSKRSLEQNKLLWKLIHHIAKETYQDDTDVYCAVLERADALSDYVITATDIADDLKKSFRGVKFIRMQEVNGKDCYVYKVYIGSSKMNTAEMNELIEITMQICGELGIDTREEWYE